MRRRSWVASTLCALTALVAAAAPAGAGAQSAFAPCGAGGETCAAVPVPLDRSGRVAGSLSLAVHRVAHGGGTAHGAFVVLAGGPGQAGNPLLGSIESALGPALNAANLDLVTVDLRGTGESSPLHCAALGSGSGVAAESAGCAAELGAKRQFFRTTDSVDDLEALRVSLGVPRLTLDGISYGTKVAEAYAVRYPTHVARLVLDSVLSADGPDPLDRPTLQATPRVLSGACAVGGCGGGLAGYLPALGALTARAGRGPIPARLVTPSGRRPRVGISSGDLLGLLESGDFNAALRADLPAAVVAARRGDAAPLARLIERSITASPGSDQPAVHPAGTPAPLASAAREDPTLFFTTFCGELPFPWSRAAGVLGRIDALETAIAAQPRAAFGGLSGTLVTGDPVIQHCLFWPGDPPPAPLAGPVPDVPVLTLSGNQDLRTPVEEAAGVASLYPHATRVVAAGTGHAVLTNAPACAVPAVTAFLLGTPRIPPACAVPGAQPRVAPPIPGGIGGLSPLGAAGRRGRVARAALDTVADALRQADFYAGGPGASVTFGGLRAGTERVTPRVLELRGLSYVPGVALTGTITPHGAAVSVVGAGQRGRLRIAAGRIVGLIGGRRVAGRFRLANPIVPAATPAVARAARAGAASVPDQRAARWRDDGTWFGLAG